MSRDPDEGRAPGYVVALGVFAAALLFGLVVLPWLGRHTGGGPQSPLVGSPAKDFMLPVISGANAGHELRLSDQQGKPVLLDFFASWCGPCREQGPIVERVATRLGASLSVLAVDTSDQRGDVESYLQQHRPAYPVLFDGDNQAAEAFAVTGLPTLVLIDRGGIVRAVEMRVVREAELEELVRGLATNSK